jgi:hypothetical protein
MQGPGGNFGQQFWVEIKVTGIFDRSGAATWALQHVYDQEHQPRGDCTDFVSNALALGGHLPQTSAWNSTLPAWINVEEFIAAMTGPTGYATMQPIADKNNGVVGNVKIGDVIVYKWSDWYNEGVDFIKGRTWDHLAIVTAIRSDGTVMVTQHTNPGTKVWNQDVNGNMAGIDSAAVIRFKV